MSRLRLSGVGLIVGALSFWWMPVLAAPAERLPDKGVKKLIEQVDEARNKFADNLDDTVKDSTVVGPGGDIRVSNFLQDYRDNTKKLQNRFNDDYAASAEVANVLKQAATIDKLMLGKSGVTKGRKEWDSEAASLRDPAEAYGAMFPLPEGAVVRRMNDKETAAAAAAISKAADWFKHELDVFSTLSKPVRDAGKEDVGLLITLADTVKDRTSDGKPATAEVRQLVQQVAKVQTFVGAQQIHTANWETVLNSLGAVRRAFGVTE